MDAQREQRRTGESSDDPEVNSNVTDRKVPTESSTEDTGREQVTLLPSGATWYSSVETGNKSHDPRVSTSSQVEKTWAQPPHSAGSPTQETIQESNWHSNQTSGPNREQFSSFQECALEAAYADSYVVVTSGPEPVEDGEKADVNKPDNTVLASNQSQANVSTELPEELIPGNSSEWRKVRRKET